MENEYATLYVWDATTWCYEPDFNLPEHKSFGPNFYLMFVRQGKGQAEMDKVVAIGYGQALKLNR